MSRFVPNPFEARSVNAGGWERHDFAPLRAVGDLAPQTPSPPSGGYPPGTNVLGIPGQPVTAEAIQWARRQIEKIRTAVGTGNLMFPAWLENYSDETSEIREHYHRMLTSESTIKAAVGTKVLSVMAQDIQVHPAEPTNARHKEAGDNFKQCLMGIGVGQRSVNAIGQQKIAWSVLIPAITNGWSVSEAVWKDAPEWRGKARGKLFYRDFKSKDPRRLTQLVDEFKNLVGLRTNLDAGRVFAGDLLQDMVFFSHWSLYESPLGISDMRAAYRAWWIKNVARRLQALGLDRFTGPFLVGKYQEGADDKRVALQQALSDARSEGWLTIPVDTMVEVVNLATGTNEVFTAAIESCDKEMLMGLLGSHLQLMEGQDGNRAGDTTEHAKQGDLFTWHLGSCLGGVITGQMAPSWYDRNYADIEPARVQWGGAKSVSEMVAQADLEKKLQELGYRQSRQQGMQFYNISEPMDANDVLAPPPPPGQQPPPGSPGLPGPGIPPAGPGATPAAQVLAGLPDRQGGVSNVPVFNGTGDVYPHEQRPQINQFGEDVRFFAEDCQPQIALFAEFEESKHKRDHGQFATNAGGSSSGDTVTPDPPSTHTEAQQVATTGVARFKAALGKLTDVAGVRQIKAAGAYLGKVTKSLHAKLSARYGPKQALAIMASGQALGWGATGAGIALGIPIVLPGSSLWGSLPAVALAEAYLQLKKLAVSMHAESDDAEADPELAQRVVDILRRKLVAWIQQNTDAGPATFAEQASPGEELASWYAGLLNDMLATDTNVDDMIQGADEELEGTGWGLDQDDDTGLWQPRQEDTDDDVRTYAESGDWEPYEGKRGGTGWKRGSRVVYGDKKPGSRPRRAPGELARDRDAKAAVAGEKGRTNPKELHARLQAYAGDLTPGQQGNASRSLAALRQHHGEIGAVKRAHQLADSIEQGLKDVEASSLSTPRKEYLAGSLKKKLAQLHHVAKTLKDDELDFGTDEFNPQGKAGGARSGDSRAHDPNDEARAAAAKAKQGAKAYANAPAAAPGVVLPPQTFQHAHAQPKAATPDPARPEETKFSGTAANGHVYVNGVQQAKAKPLSSADTPLSAPDKSAPDPQFAQDFGQHFDRLNKEAGGHNFVHVNHLRKALNVPRERFDAQLNHLQRSRDFTASPAEGRHGLTADDVEGGIKLPAVTGSGHELLTHVSRRNNPVRNQVAQPQGRQKIQGAPTVEHVAAASRFADASPGLSPEKRTEYTEHLAHALSVLPPGIAKATSAAINHAQGGVRFHNDLSALRSTAQNLGGNAAKGVVGFANDRGMGTEVHLDGGEDPRGTYVHELWHAADNNSLHSDDKGWQSAYKKDILKGRNLLSRYAMTNPSEGFAEFGRALAEKGVAEMESKFPNVVKHLRSKGLI